MRKSWAGVGEYCLNPVEQESMLFVQDLFVYAVERNSLHLLLPTPVSKNVELIVALLVRSFTLAPLPNEHSSPDGLLCSTT